MVGGGHLVSPVADDLVVKQLDAAVKLAIRDRTAGGRTIKATKGGYACGRIPYGYRLGAEGQFEIEPEQAKVVRRIFAERKRGLTLKAIADKLNADGILSPKGGVWHPGRISYVLDNPKYRGASEYLFRWSGAETHVLQEGTHTPIISPV